MFSICKIRFSSVLLKINILISLKHNTNRVRVLTTITLSMALVTVLGVSIDSAFAVPGQGTIFAVQPFNPNNPATSILYTVTNGGVLAQIGTTGVVINTLAYNPSSQIMYGGEGGGGLGNPGAGNFYTVDQTSGATNLVGNNGIGSSYDGLDFAPDGTLYGVLNGGGNLVIIDETTGLILTDIGSTTLNVKGISFDNSGFLWAIDQNSNLYTIDTGDAQATFKIASNPSVQAASLQILCDGTAYVGTKFSFLGPNDFGTVDRITGAFSLLSNSADTIGGLTVTDECLVGGELLPIDTTALILAGAQTNAVWIMSILAVIGSIAFGALYITSKKN